MLKIKTDKYTYKVSEVKAYSDLFDELLGEMENFWKTKERTKEQKLIKKFRYMYPVEKDMGIFS